MWVVKASQYNLDHTLSRPREETIDASDVMDAIAKFRAKVNTAFGWNWFGHAVYVSVARLDVAIMDTIDEIVKPTPARLDSAGTAKPKTELVGHFRAGDCVGPESTSLDGVRLRDVKSDEDSADCARTVQEWAASAAEGNVEDGPARPKTDDVRLRYRCPICGDEEDAARTAPHCLECGYEPGDCQHCGKKGGH